MARMTVALNGEVVFDDEVAQWQMPPAPDQIPAAARAGLDPNHKPAPFMKLMMLAMIGKACERALRDPRLAPLDVDLQTNGSTGWTLTVVMPGPGDGGQT